MFLGQKIVNFVQRQPHLLHEPFVLSFETNVLFANLYQHVHLQYRNYTNIPHRNFPRATDLDYSTVGRCAPLQRQTSVALITS